MEKPVNGFGFKIYIPAGIYLLKGSNRNTRTRCDIFSKLRIKTPEPRHWRGSGVFILYILYFQHISHLVLVFLSLTLNICLLAGISINPLCISLGARLALGFRKSSFEVQLQKNCFSKQIFAGCFSKIQLY